MYKVQLFDILYLINVKYREKNVFFSFSKIGINKIAYFCSVSSVTKFNNYSKFQRDYFKVNP